jgi:cytochrome c heme-lyase
VDPATNAPHSTWAFPSPQRFYNAMTRKGWQADERTIPAVVSIHNTVNEETWRRVQRYEALHRAHCTDSRLARFRGRPNDRCGKEVRYVIDFYGASSSDDNPMGQAAAIHIDARPALDRPGALWDRIRLQARDWL